MLRIVSVLVFLGLLVGDQIYATTPWNKEKKFTTLSAIEIAPGSYDTIQRPSKGTPSRITPQGFGLCINQTVEVLSKITDPVVLTAEDWSNNCVGFLNGTDVKCDFSSFTAYDSNGCRNAGGRIVPLTIEMCSLNIFVGDAGGSNSGSTKFVEKIQISNFPQCAGMSCNQNEISRVINGDNKVYGVRCPRETKFNRFLLKRNKSGTLIVKNCQWLATKPWKARGNICRNKKFQVYVEDLLPASRMCQITCAPFSCVQEKPTAKFLYDAVFDEDGRLRPSYRQCKFLTTVRSEQLEEICWPSNKNMAYLDSKYGYGWEVCTDSCPNTCKE